MSPRVMTIVARIIVVLWAGFWTFFCVASAIGEKEGVAGALLHQVPAGVMLVSAGDGRGPPGRCSLPKGCSSPAASGSTRRPRSSRCSACRRSWPGYCF